MVKIVGPKCFAPPPSRQGKSFYAIPHPLLKGGNLLWPPPVWLKLQAPVLKLPQNLLYPPSGCLKLFQVPPTAPFFIFCIGVTLHLPLPSCFIYPPPPSTYIITDHFLSLVEWRSHIYNISIVFPASKVRDIKFKSCQLSLTSVAFGY